MSSLTPLIELAAQKSLDIFFRVGQGYLAQSLRDTGQRHGMHGLSPIGVQTRAEARILCALGPVTCDLQPYARPGGATRAR